MNHTTIKCNPSMARPLSQIQVLKMENIKLSNENGSLSIRNKELTCERDFLSIQELKLKKEANQIKSNMIRKDRLISHHSIFFSPYSKTTNINYQFDGRCHLSKSSTRKIYPSNSHSMRKNDRKCN